MDLTEGGRGEDTGRGAAVIEEATEVDKEMDEGIDDGMSTGDTLCWRVGRKTDVFKPTNTIAVKVRTVIHNFL